MEYAGKSFEAVLDSNTETKHIDSHYYSKDIFISLTIILKNQIFDYMEINEIV